jgi:hypothetical protein
MRRFGALLLLACFICAGSAAAQSTGTTAFAAPYRAFSAHEVGGTLSFPKGGGFAAEGLYGFGSGKFDIGLRGGFFNPDGGDTHILAGVNLRQRVLEHTESFPLDGAVVFGVGGQFGNGTHFNIPVGISLGRRLDVEDSEVSIVPFVQPTAFLTHSSANNISDTNLNFALGIGGDFRLSRMFDARVSVGLGDLQGISISAVWLR